MRLHSGIVDTQEFVGRGHHVNTVGLSVRTFFVHELVDRFIRRRILEDNAHYQKERPAQGGRAAFRNAAATDIYSTGLVRRSVNASKSDQRFLGVKRRTSPISAMNCGPRTEPTPNIRIKTGYSGRDAARVCISFRSAARAAEVVRSWETACSTRSFAVLVFGMTPKCLQAEV